MSTDRIFRTTGAPTSPTAAAIRLASGTAIDLAIGTPSAPKKSAARRSSKPETRPASSASSAPIEGSARRGTGCGGRRRRQSAIASAQDSGWRKAGTPAAVSNASDFSADGVNATAKGLPDPANRNSGSTASSGLNCADEPTTKITASLPSSASRRSMVPATISGLAPAKVRSTSLPSPAEIPNGFNQSTRLLGGPAISRPATAMLSTTMAAPPPVVVATATRWPPRLDCGRSTSSAGTSISDSNIDTRAMPWRRQKASKVASDPAMAPVCERASSWPMSERPSL